MATSGDRLITFFTQLSSDSSEWKRFRTDGCDVVSNSKILQEPEKTWMLEGDVVKVGEAIDAAAAENAEITILFSVVVPKDCI